MAIEELLPHLKYSKCDCAIDYKADLGIVNGICPQHPKSVLLINGRNMEAHKRYIESRKLDKERDKPI
jgi:hypothetical protein